MLSRSWRRAETICCDDEYFCSPRLSERQTAGRFLRSFGGRSPSGAPTVAIVTGVHWPQATSRRRRRSKVRRPSFVGQCSFRRTSRAGAPDKVLLARAHLAFATFVRCAGATGRGCGISSERSIRAGRLPAAARLRWLAVVQLCRDLTCRKERRRRRRAERVLRHNRHKGGRVGALSPNAQEFLIR